MPPPHLYPLQPSPHLFTPPQPSHSTTAAALPAVAAAVARL
ncbi:hypothetical protein Tco_0582430, partial [Tanacetum coccineum]